MPSLGASSQSQPRFVSFDDFPVDNVGLLALPSFDDDDNKNQMTPMMPALPGFADNSTAVRLAPRFQWSLEDF